MLYSLFPQQTSITWYNLVLLMIICIQNFLWITTSRMLFLFSEIKCIPIIWKIMLNTQDIQFLKITQRNTFLMKILDLHLIVIPQQLLILLQLDGSSPARLQGLLKSKLRAKFQYLRNKHDFMEDSHPFDLQERALYVTELAL